MKFIQKGRRGFSLIEILVVIVLFATVATIAAEATIRSLRGAQKSDSITDIRDNIDFAVSIMERSLRNAKDIQTCTTPPNPPYVEYIDEFDTVTSFGCDDFDGDGLIEIASGSARLTSRAVDITSCEFACVTPASGSPSYVEISVTGVTVGAEGINRSPVSVDTRVNLRVY